MTDHEIFLLVKVCHEIDKLQVELSPRSVYTTPGPEEIRERLLKVCDVLDELQVSAGIASPKKE